MAKVLQPQETRAIRKTRGVVGGSACIRDTRISVSLLVGWRKQGVSDSELIEYYPSLCQRDLENAWAYYRVHGPEIDEALRTNDDDA